MDAASRDGEPLPLAGRQIVLTRPRKQAGTFTARIRALGGEPVVAPAIAIEPCIPAAAAARGATSGGYDWIVFTSANAVRAAMTGCAATRSAAAMWTCVRLAAIGPATAAALTALDRSPDFVAGTSESESVAFARALPIDAGQRVLLPRGDLAHRALPDALRARGALVDELVVYRTVAGDGALLTAELMQAGTADAVLFASASAVRFVVEALRRGSTPAARSRDFARRVPSIFCLGRPTAAAARTAGLQPTATARVATQDALIDAVADWFAPRSPARLPLARST